MHEGDAADRPEPGLTRPAQVPPMAISVAWREVWDPSGVAHRYGVVGALLAAGIGAARIQVFHDSESGAAYWVIAPDGGRLAVLTDDTEEHAGHLEGLWPFKAVFLTPNRVRTEIDYSINDLTAQIVTWCTEAAGTRTVPAGGEGSSDTAVGSNQVILDCGLPFEERIEGVVRPWIRDGRGRDHLLTGKAFFAVYSWHLRHWTDHDIAWAEFVAASYDSIGGEGGWEAMLREHEVCDGCGDRYRLENIGLCTGCMRYTCYACGSHGSCTGEIL